MSLSEQEKRILFLSLLNSLVWILLGGALEYADSSDYLSAFESITDNHLDILRTPVYPIYLGILRFVFGFNQFENVAIIGQYLLFSVSAICFYRIAKTLMSPSKVPFIISLIYIFSPGIFSWNNAILTESFSISGMVFMLYFLIKLYKECTLQNICFLGFWMVFLLFLRPSFIYILPCFILFWVVALFKKDKKKQALYGLSVCMVGITLFSVYLFEFKKEYGVYAPSSVSYVNRYYIARTNGLIDSNETTDAELKRQIEGFIDRNGICSEGGLTIYQEANVIINKNGLSKLNDALKASVNNHPSKWVRIIVKQFVDAGRANVFSGSSHKIHQYINYLFGVYIHHVYILLLIYGCVLVYNLKRKKTLLLSFMLFMVGFCNLFVSIIAAQADWGRLNICVLPFYILILCQFYEYIKYGNLKKEEIV